MDLAAALDSDDPEQYMSQLPVHMDGSCNGLQHYAALGRDALGGEQVNLVPTAEPQDVYTGVADLVIQQIEEDAGRHSNRAQSLQRGDRLPACSHDPEKRQREEANAVRTDAAGDDK